MLVLERARASGGMTKRVGMMRNSVLQEPRATHLLILPGLAPYASFRLDPIRYESTCSSNHSRKKILGFLPRTCVLAFSPSIRIFPDILRRSSTLLLLRKRDGKCSGWLLVCKCSYKIDPPFSDVTCRPCTEMGDFLPGLGWPANDTLVVGSELVWDSTWTRVYTTWAGLPFLAVVHRLPFLFPNARRLLSLFPFRVTHTVLY